MRTVVLRVTALALLLLLAVVTVITMRTLQRVPDTVVYFLRSGSTTFSLAPAYRARGRGDQVGLGARSVASLARGPTAEESAQGLTSAVPADTVVRSAELRDGVMTINVSAEFERGGGTASMLGRLNQLLYTLTQPSTVDAVRLEVEGRPVGVFGGEGIVVPTPWLRSDYPDHPEW